MSGISKERIVEQLQANRESLEKKHRQMQEAKNIIAQLEADIHALNGSCQTCEFWLKTIEEQEQSQANTPKEGKNAAVPEAR